MTYHAGCTTGGRVYVVVRLSSSSHAGLRPLLQAIECCAILDNALFIEAGLFLADEAAAHDVSIESDSGESMLGRYAMVR